MKHAKKAFLASLLATLLCVTMLIGTTFAWFTDSVTSGGNIIKSGTLDVEMSWADGTKSPTDTETVWKDASTGAIFDYSFWEPGYTQARHLAIKNVGTLALKYQIRILQNGAPSDLGDVIDVYYLDPAEQLSERVSLNDKTPIGTVSTAFAGSLATGHLLPDEGDTITIALKMRESAGNEYQNKSLGADFTIQLLATQYTYEEDSFDDQYDYNADETPDHAEWAYETSVTMETVVAGEETVLEASASPAAAAKAPKVTFDVGALTVGEDAVLTVKTKNVLASTEDEGFVLEGSDDNAVAALDLTLTVGGTETTSFAGKNATVETYITKGLESVIVKYPGATGTFSGAGVAATKVEVDTAATEKGTATYNPSTGYLSFVTDHFSQYIVYDDIQAYNATTDTVYTKLQSAIDAAASGNTVVLLKDIAVANYISVKKSLILDGGNHAITVNANRGIRVENSDVDVTVKNLKMPKTNKNERAVQVDSEKTGVKLTVDRCELHAINYTVNICDKVGVDLAITNSKLYGWGVINAWSANYTINISGCELYGHNDKGYNADGWNNFGTVVLEGDTTGATDMAAHNLTVNIENTKISATTSGQGNIQFCIVFNNPASDNTLNLNNCTLVYNEDENTFLRTSIGVNNLFIDGVKVVDPVAEEVIEEETE